jgi:2-keto-4-pentenoate hydratase
VVLEELRHRDEQLQAGDLISAGSFMPPIPVTSGLITRAIYSGIGGQDLEVSAFYE